MCHCHRRELYLKHRLVLQCYCTSSSVGGCLRAQSGIHPFMWKPCVSYQSSHPLLCDRLSGCRGTLPVCSCLQRRSTKHPRLVKSLSPWGEDIYSFLRKFPMLHKHGRTCKTFYLHCWATFQNSSLLTAVVKKTLKPFGVEPVLSNVIMSLSFIDCVSADQQNPLKVVRASKPRTRKSSKVIVLSFCFFLFFIQR